MNPEGVVRIEFNKYFEGIEIKRGTPFKEFLYEFFLVKSFLFLKSEFGQTALIQPAQNCAG